MSECFLAATASERRAPGARADGLREDPSTCFVYHTHSDIPHLRLDSSSSSAAAAAIASNSSTRVNTAVASDLSDPYQLDSYRAHYWYADDARPLTPAMLGIRLSETSSWAVYDWHAATVHQLVASTPLAPSCVQPNMLNWPGVA